MYPFLGPTPNAILYFTNVNTQGVALDYLEYDLKNVTITNYSTSSGGDVPSESFTFFFTAITIKRHLTGVPVQQLTFNLATNVLG